MNLSIAINITGSDVDSVVEVEGCDLFAVDADPAGRFAVVRGLTFRVNR